ncbi:MAG: hypothetical protein AAF573_07115 [Bacteroidota bacterium]
MKKLLQILNIVAFVAMVYVNYLSNALPINGRTPGQISDSLPNEFVPAGLTFSIWGVIYLLLLGFVIYQAKDLFRSKANNDSWFWQVGIFFILTCAANIGWIFVWHYGYYLISVGVMITFLVLLIIIYQRLNIGKVTVSSSVRWLVHHPFSVYLGWITVATIANVTAYLVSIGWDGFGILEVYWAIIMIIVAAYIGQRVLSSRGDIGYGLVLIWAFFGIVLKQWSGFEGTPNNVAIAAIIGGILVFMAMLPPLVRSFR